FAWGCLSKGGGVPLDVALRWENRPPGAALFSGNLVARPEWERRARKRAGLPIFQSHGRQDPLLPFSGAQALRDLLVQAGIAVEFLAFDGGHAIPPSVVERSGQFLLARLRDASSDDNVGGP